MKRKLSSNFPVVLASLVFLFIFSFLSLKQYLTNSSIHKKIELSGFNTDLSGNSGTSSVYSKDLSKKDLFLAYSSYTTLQHGEYSASFHFNGAESDNAECSLEIVSDKGKKTRSRSGKKVISGHSVLELNFKLSVETEIEPRVKYFGGSKNIELEKVVFTRIKSIYPAGKLILRTLYLSPIFFFALIAFYFALIENEKWKLSLAAFLTYTGIFLIIKFAWMSEDALITLRHVENFLSGNGAVFNPGERVEGYTHTLWFWIIALLRWIGLPPKGAMVLPGVLFSAVSLSLLFFVLWGKENKKTAISFSGAFLIGMSSFIDFGTSGLESPLSYLLLIIFSIFISGRIWKDHPLLFGLIVTLMTFNRPDFGIFLILGFVFYFYEYFKKEIPFKTIMNYGFPPALLLGLYEIFRMGYYGAVFPNPFFAKSGSSSYFSQGFLYLGDLLKGSSFIIIIILALTTLFIRRGKGDFSGRIRILSAGVFYGFFVIRGGGDFMHGRFLLPAVLLIAISSSGAFDKYFEKTKILSFTAVCIIVLSVLISLAIIPVQKRGEASYSHGISDERFTFYGNKVFPLDQIVRDDHIFMWKTIGNNYRFLTERAKRKIKVAYHTVGFIGYYSGLRVNILDRLGLTDPIVARRQIEKRGRPGHEKSAPFGYLVYRKLTFGETPFRIWNDLAGTSFGVLWDLSRGTLNKFSFFLKEDFKSKLDSGINSFLKELPEENIEKNADLLFFLKQFWYPFAPADSKAFFNSIYDENMIFENSDSLRWITDNEKKIEKWDSVIKGRLSGKKFLSNIKFAVTGFFNPGD